MLVSSEKFPEQFSRVQQQFKEWTQFEQLFAAVELTRTFQSSYRYFLVQLFQANIQYETNDMFNHTVDDANAPDIVTCLLSNSLDKILFTLQLYLPLISTKTMHEKLLHAYRDVLIHLDSNLHNPSQFSYTEQQLINFSQQILFFIQTNPNLQSLSFNIPQLIHLVHKTKKLHSDEQQYHQPLQRYPSIRSQVQPLMNYSSEGSHLSTTCQQLKRHETSDSGVDLTEPTPMQTFLSGHNQQHSLVVKTASSPIPEHASINTPARMPLKGVFSAPSPSVDSDYRQKNSNYHLQRYKTNLTISDEEQESQQQIEDYSSGKANINDNARPLGQFYSLRYRNMKSNQNKDDVSQYLGVDANSAPTRNTFTQPNTGMRDVPKWLKHLRLHKYDVFFSQMTYDQMMNLTMEQLKELHITDGACSKILINIKKLKDRSITLKQCFNDFDNGQTDLQNVVQQLNETMVTPIRSKQLEHENNSDEDLPQLIMQILEKVSQQLTPSSSSDICNNLLGLFDRCYRHEAFTSDQRHILLQWRGRLSNILQTLGKIEYRAIQTFSQTSPQRRVPKPSVRPVKSSSGPYYPNYPPNTISLSKFSSEPQNNNNLIDPQTIRRPTKSPTLIYSTAEESHENNLQASFSCLTSTPQQRNNGAYLANNRHPVLSRKASIDPYGESNANNRTKLCKTFSDPNRIRFGNPAQMNHMQLSSVRSQQNSIRMVSTPYSQQHRQFISRSPPTSTIEIPSAPIKKCFSDNERSNYYGNNNDITSSSNSNNKNDIENLDDQRHNNTEFESFCRQITESAISDDVNDSSFDHKEEISDVSNIKPSSNNSTDTEQ